MSDIFAIAGPILRILDAETAHNLTITALYRGLNPFKVPPATPQLATKVLGLELPNPVGIAAGFDKNAEVPDQMLAMGFGFAEVGTVTPQPQDGNPRPRLFRLQEDGAVINRMGFNNQGHAAAQARLRARRGKPGIVGVNIGANKTSEDRIADYLLGLEAFHDLASYLTINVSSPNTPGLRGLQSRGELEELIGRLMAKRAELQSTTPLLLKIAPDLGDDELDDIAAVCLDAGIDGLIISNTTISRPPLTSSKANEQGGLSGAPLFEMSTVVLAKMYRRTRGELPLIGVGGITSGETAWQKIRAGASLIQLYSALVYQGPKLVWDIRYHVAAQLAAGSYNNLADAVGSGAQEWEAK
ncbi:MAG: quinone-dependent dihydroorotate dehydrogenase [Rhizobiales bacterium]|nr:quinone-dependent dihydroorotate dehydrogenase [Hyphomicrobiales bacterium]